jgi:2-polyprenyl-3-methyl-5-hydroxy-6-metoxy-1,4-benzoquinol methylase
MKPDQNEVIAGQAVYSKLVLNVYDIWVLGISNSYIWKCSSGKILNHFRQHISANHLDVGVGTGYFLDKCNLPLTSRIALMDLNNNSLQSSSTRLSRYNPEKYRQNILEPLNYTVKPFDSISLNYLLHCLPGDLSQKAVVFDNVLPLLSTGGTIFGSTILQGKLRRNAAAVKLMNIYNRKGIFSNTMDTLEELENVMGKRFKQFEIKTEGCVALFSAKKD